MVIALKGHIVVFVLASGRHARFSLFFLTCFIRRILNPPPLAMCPTVVSAGDGHVPRIGSVFLGRITLTWSWLIFSCKSHVPRRE